MISPIIIHGSSRSFGNTWDAIQTILGEHKLPLVDLTTLNIFPYDYDHKNSGDDFLPLMERVVRHDHIVLATPVYWYTMSAHMKMFLDRWTDGLTIRKDLGRALRGKDLSVIASFGTSVPVGFEDAFSQMCEYMEMRYSGCSFIYSGDEEHLKQKNPSEIEKARRILGLTDQNEVDTLKGSAI